MKEQFVTYEIALKFKELGFDEPCLAIFDLMDNNELHTWRVADSEICNSQIIQSKMITAPLWQQVVDWFREKYSLIIRQSFYKESFELHFNDWDIESVIFEDNKEKAILKAIELIQVQ